MTEASLPPAREDDLAIDVPGRYVPVGFGRYVSPVATPLDYIYYRVAAWRVAVPRTLSVEKMRALLDRVYVYGPQSVGYVRVGDTLVPAALSPGDRNTIAEVAIAE